MAFNPDEARDEKGRWTRAGAKYAPPKIDRARRDALLTRLRRGRLEVPISGRLARAQEGAIGATEGYPVGKPKLMDVRHLSFDAMLQTHVSAVKLERFVAGRARWAPILVNRKGVIFNGHHRAVASRMLGYRTIPAQVVE